MLSTEVVYCEICMALTSQYADLTGCGQSQETSPGVVRASRPHRARGFPFSLRMFQMSVRVRSLTASFVAPVTGRRADRSPERVPRRAGTSAFPGERGARPASPRGPSGSTIPSCSGPAPSPGTPAPHATPRGPSWKIGGGGGLHDEHRRFHHSTSHFYCSVAIIRYKIPENLSFIPNKNKNIT